MSSTTVRFRNQAFEANDATLEVWLALLVQEIDRLGETSGWLQEVRDDWQFQSTAGFGYGVLPHLDRFASDDERRNLILTLAEGALRRLESFGPTIPNEVIDELNPGGESGDFASDVPAAPFRRTGRLFVKILKGTLTPEDNAIPYENYM